MFLVQDPAWASHITKNQCQGTLFTSFKVKTSRHLCIPFYRNRAVAPTQWISSVYGPHPLPPPPPPCRVELLRKGGNLERCGFQGRRSVARAQYRPEPLYLYLSRRQRIACLARFFLGVFRGSLSWFVAARWGLHRQIHLRLATAVFLFLRRRTNSGDSIRWGHPQNRQ